MSERYFKSPRVNVRDRAREFEAKQSNDTAGKTALPIANRRPSTTPKLPKDATATTTTTASVSSSDGATAGTLPTTVKDENNSTDKTVLLPLSGSSPNPSAVKSSETDKICSSSSELAKNDGKEIVKVKLVKKEKGSTVKKKSIKLKDGSETDNSTNKEKTDSKNDNDKVSGDTATRQPLSKSTENGATAVSNSANGADGKSDTIKSSECLTDLGDGKTMTCSEAPADVIPTNNTEELVKQFNKLSSSQLAVLQKKSCSLDSGLSEITNWVNEEENDTGDDARVSVADGKSFVCGAKFRKFRNGGLVKNHQPRSTATPTADSKNKNGCLNQIENENIEAQGGGHDMCLEMINKTDSGKSGSQVMCKSPHLNQRSTSYLRYLQKITQLQQQQRNSEAANMQQLVNENFNAYANNESCLKEKEDENSFKDNLRSCYVENVDKDNWKGGVVRVGGVIEDKKQKTKLGRMEINSDGNSSHSSNSSQIETKKNLDECFGGLSANSKSVAATSFSNSLSGGGGTTSKNSSTTSTEADQVVKRDGSTTSVTNLSLITSTLAPKSHYLSSSPFSSSSSPTVTVTVTDTSISKSEDEKDEVYNEDNVEKEDAEAAIDSKFRPSLHPSQNKWKTRQHQPKTKQQQLTSTTLLNPLEHQHKQVETNFHLEAETPEEENTRNTRKKIGGASTVGTISRSGTNDGTDSINDVNVFGSWDYRGDYKKNPSYHLEQPVNESNQIAELLTSVRKIREEFERCSLEVEQEVEEEAKEGQNIAKEKNYAGNNVRDYGDLVLPEFTTNRQSTASVDSFNSIPSQVDDAGRCKLECCATGERVKKSCIPKISSSSLSTTNKNSTIAHNQIFGSASKTAYHNDDDKDADNLSILVNSFGYPSVSQKEDNRFHGEPDEVERNKKYVALNKNLNRLKRSAPEIEKQNWNNLLSENPCNYDSKLVDDGKRMERRNSPSGPVTSAARPLNSKPSDLGHIPASPIGFQRNFDIGNCGSGGATYANTNSNGINSCPNSPRSILTNKSASTHPSVHFNYLNLYNNNYQPQQTFSSNNAVSPTNKLLIRSKPELPSYLTQRRRPALRKVTSDPNRYESVSDSEKRELEKIESILGELDFSKYKRGSVYNNRQSNQTSPQQQQLTAQQQQQSHCNYSSLVPIRAPSRRISQQNSISSPKVHQEKLRELRELTEKLKPTSSKLKFESSTSPSSSSSATSSPYPSFFNSNLNNADGLSTFKTQNYRSHHPVFRSASVPQVDDYEDYATDNDNSTILCNQSANNSHNLHKSYSSSEYITDSVPTTSVKLSSPFEKFYYNNSADQNRLNTVSAFATLPRASRGVKMDKSESGNENWTREDRQRLSDVDEGVRHFPVDYNADEGLVADSAVSDYMQAYRNVTSSFSAPATPVTRHRVPNTSHSVDRFDLQVEAVIAELQATTSATNNFVNAATTPANMDILNYNSLDRRKRRKGAGLAVGFNMAGGPNELTAKSGNGRSLTYPPQRRTSITDGMEYTSMDSNGIPSYIAINPAGINSVGSATSEGIKSGDGGAGCRSRYSLQVADDAANFPSELSLADSHLCPSEISYGTTYNDVLESVTAEPADIGSGNDCGVGGNGKALKKKHYSDPSGEKNNEGILLDLPEFIACAKSEPQLPSNKKYDAASGTFSEDQVLNRSRQSCTSLIPQQYVPSGLTRSTSLSPSVGGTSSDSPSAPFSTNSVGRNGGSGSAEVTLERSDSKSPQQQRRYSKKRLRGPYGEMLEEEMRKSGEKHSQKVIAEELSFLKELMETKSSSNVDGVPQVIPSSSHIEPIHSRHHLSSQSLDENALRSNQTIIDIYNKRSIGGNTACDSGGSGDGTNVSDMCYTSSVPTLLDNRLKSEGSWNLCESLDAEGDDLEPLLKRHQDTRTHVVAELYDTEKSYVESLQILVNKYFRPLKSPEYSGIVDSHLVEEMFFQIPEILNHHEVFLEVLKQRLENWDNKQIVGDVFVESFTRQPVIDTYTAFINNWKLAKEAIKIATQAKPAFAKFLEHMSREHKGKLTLDALLIMPVQRIPRYELLIKELLKHTQLDHPDHRLLVTAQKEVHDLAVKINHMEREAYETEQMQLKLRELENLIEGLIDLVHPMRTFLRYDLVTMSGSLGAKKERCLFLFSDLLVIASIKKKSGPMRKTATLGSPGSLSYLMEMNKYKLLMKISLDDLDIARSNDTNIKKVLKDIEQLEGDLSLLNQINDLSGGLSCTHQNLDDVVKEMLASVTKALQERQTADSQLLCLELTVTTQVGVEIMSIIFGAPDRRAFWETAFHEAKQKLALSTDRRPPPEFLYPLPIRKTRAGLQFTCAAPTLGLNVHNMRDVWVCNSDGYVGQVCVLSLQPEPTVTSCNGVCNSRILCIASIPAAAPVGELLASRRRSAYLENRSGISISIEDVDEDDAYAGNGNIQLDSDSSEEEKEPSSESQDEESDRRRRGESPSDDCKADDVDNQSPTMWLGTEDGCIHVYNCNDNIRIKKNKIKLQHPAVIHCIIHMDNKVFVSLANGDVAVYHRDPAGGWNTSEPTTISIGTSAAPVTRMLPVMSKLWCGCHNIVKIVCTTNLEVEHSFPAHVDNNRPIQCMVNSGLGVWTSVQNSSVIKLFHATSFEILLEVNVASAVSKMLAAGCDDIIRQHKTACLRVTSLLACKDLLWIGTSAGVVLNLLLPHLSSTTTKLASIPNVTGIPHGHTGHVRFLTCVDMTSLQEGIRRGKYSHRSTIKYRDGHSVGRRASTSALGSNRLLVISGGDGYEDFRNTNFSEAAGRDDSTNHLLLWQV
ncbi:hypothetical protein CHUAL_004523 [Chamberlinius hualienensis]